MQKKIQHILKRQDPTRIADISTIKQEEIDRLNRMDLKKNRNFRNNYRPVSRRLEEKTFIVPSVNSGAITCYLFTKKSKPEPPALIVYLHDGGWMLGNMDKCRAICSNICNQTDAAVLAVDYRLSPEFKFPIPVEDCYNAVVWACNGTKYWKINSQKVFVMGDCSGANIAAAVTRLLRDRKGPSLAGQILIEPLTDCRLRTESLLKYSKTPLLSSKDLVFYMKNYQREQKDILDPLCSPLLAIDFSRLPQALIISPEIDPLYDDSVYYAKALNSAEVPAKVLSVKNQIHGFMSYPEAEGWQESMFAIRDFIHLKALDSITLQSAKERRKNLPKSLVL